MKASWKSCWKRSTQPRKQRKYIYNAPVHIRQKFMRSHLSILLRKKYGRRSIRVRVGDKVMVMRGNFRKKHGKVERISLKHSKVYITGIEVMKKDGSKALFPIHPSNLMIEEIELSDKIRRQKLEKNEITHEKVVQP